MNSTNNSTNNSANNSTNCRAGSEANNPNAMLFGLGGCGVCMYVCHNYTNSSVDSDLEIISLSVTFTSFHNNNYINNDLP